MGKLLTIDEASEILRVSRRTMERYIVDCQIPKYKISGKVLIEEREIEKLLKRSQVL